MNLYNWHNSSALATLLALFIISPIVAIFYSAFLGDTTLWPHLFSTVLPRYVYNTIVLMIGVGILSIIFGVSSAWVVTRYNFFGKNLESVTDKSRLNPSVGSYGGRDLGGVYCPGIILKSFVSKSTLIQIL